MQVAQIIKIRSPDLNRIVMTELLDTLPPAHPSAVRSRSDLRRVNAWMGNVNILLRALKSQLDGVAPGSILDLGAGDGRFLLALADRLPMHRSPVSATLVDRMTTPDARTLSRFAALNWRVKSFKADVFEWAETSGQFDVIVANLFLHHLKNLQLARLLEKISLRTRLFIAVEPRRGRWPWLCSRLLWATGCNAVTRHDAAVSVAAGFSGSELSSLWPQTGWSFTEERAGPFSHLFIARRHRIESQP